MTKEELIDKACEDYFSVTNYDDKHPQPEDMRFWYEPEPILAYYRPDAKTIFKQGMECGLEQSSWRPVTDTDEWPKDEVFLVLYKTEKGNIITLTCWDSYLPGWHALSPKLRSDEELIGKAIYWMPIISIPSKP